MISISGDGDLEKRLNLGCDSVVWTLGYHSQAWSLPI